MAFDPSEGLAYGFGSWPVIILLMGGVILGLYFVIKRSRKKK